MNYLPEKLQCRQQDLLARTESIAGTVSCPPFLFDVKMDADLGYVYIQAKLYREDIETCIWDYGYGSQFVITPDMIDDVITKRFFVAARDYGEHEVREAFGVNGRRVLGPHIPIQALRAIAEPVERTPDGS